MAPVTLIGYEGAESIPMMRYMAPGVYMADDNVSDTTQGHLHRGGKGEGSESRMQAREFACVHTTLLYRQYIHARNSTAPLACSGATPLLPLLS
jgi:hypothetical protein